MPTSENPQPSDLRRSVIDDLPVTVEAILGVATVKVAELSSLAVGGVFTLDALLGDPVELRLNGTAIAQGELVSVGDRFALRIQKLAER
jgi:flagellar motor switch protein FliN/FliY